MKRGWFLLVALSLGLNAGLLYVRLAGPPAWQQMGPPDQGPPPGQNHRPPNADVLIQNHLRGMARHLDLDNDQREAVTEILQEKMPLMVELREQARVASDRISQIFGDANFDEIHFREAVFAANRARASVDSMSAAMLLAEASVLTPEQRIIYARLAPNVHSNPGGPPGGRPGMRPGGRPRDMPRNGPRDRPPERPPENR